jgi:cyclase
VSTSWVRKVAEVLDIPFAVAGGLRSLRQAAECLEAGADKLSLNSPALENPQLIGELAREFGSQCVVLGVDTFATGRDYVVYQYSGRPDRSRDTGRNTLDWIREAVDRGAGEVVLNCMRQDGVRSGYDIGHTRQVIETVSVPVIASGGAGAPEHFRDIFEAGASGALAASVFHDRLIAIPDLKEFLSSCGFEVRP